MFQQQSLFVLWWYWPQTADCKKAATSNSKAKAHAAAVKEKEKEEPPKKG